MVTGVSLWSTCIQTSNACTARDIVWNCIALGRKCLLNIELKSITFFYRKYYIAYGWGCAASTALHYIIQCIAHCMAMSQLLHYIAHCHVTPHRLGARVFTREQLEADQPLPAIHAHASPFFSRYHGGKHDQIKIKS